MPTGVVPRIGLAICVLGLVVACLSLIPALVPPGEFPWPVFVGAFIYLPGSFLVFFGSKGKERNQAYNLVRLIRIGFFAIIALTLFTIFGRP